MKKMIGVLAALLLCFVGTLTVSGQSNEVLDQLLEEKQATMGNATYLVFVAAGIASEDWSTDRSVQELASLGWGFEDAQPGDLVKLGALAFMIMKSFDMKGGIMYSIFPGRRYAAKEFAYLRFAPGNSSAYRTLSGIDVANILGRAMDFLGQPELEGAVQ